MTELFCSGLSLEFRKGQNIIIVGETGTVCNVYQLLFLLFTICLLQSVLVCREGVSVIFLIRRAFYLFRDGEDVHLQGSEGAVDSIEWACLPLCGAQPSLCHVYTTEATPYQWHSG